MITQQYSHNNKIFAPLAIGRIIYFFYVAIPCEAFKSAKNTKAL